MTKQLILKAHHYKSNSYTGKTDVIYAIYEDDKPITGWHSDRPGNETIAHVTRHQIGNHVMFTSKRYTAENEPAPPDDLYGVARMETTFTDGTPVRTAPDGMIRERYDINEQGF